MASYNYHPTDNTGLHPQQAYSDSHPSPYGSGDGFYNQSTGYLAPAGASPPKKGVSKWVKIGIPVAIVVIAAAVVGGVLATRKNKDDDNNSSSAINSNPSAVVSVKNDIGHFPSATNSEYLQPMYPSTTNSAAYGPPTILSTTDSKIAWPKDPWQPPNPQPTNVREDRPRLIAPAYKWAALPELIANDPYMAAWNDSIFANATVYFSKPPVQYYMDGASGILDIAREVKQRLKAYSYCYRMTKDTKWVDQAWVEIQNSASNGTTPFGNNTADRWNAVTHFLDPSEFLAGYAIAYDWMYDAWPDDKKAMIRATMNQFGMSYGLQTYTDPTTAYWGWWNNDIKGNWNCVCNNGLTMAALALLGDQTDGVPEKLLGYTIPNALENCIYGFNKDGTWNETNDYWYFGATGHAEMSASLISAAGSDFGMLSTNPGIQNTGWFHMYAQGPGSLFNYGDTGPNKFTATANSIMLYGAHYKIPQYLLWQRDQVDSFADPWSMFWYDPAVTGAFWDGLPLDHFFTEDGDQWGSMRSSWTDYNALFVAIKAGWNQRRQAHNDLDIGDFVIDAMGTRWIGELGDGDYLSDGYFDKDVQEDKRWLYYRKASEGQNVILVNQANQLVGAAPTINYGTTNTTQTGGSTVFKVPDKSTAFFTTDITTAYSGVTSYQRGIRMINNRKQVLLQDDINASNAIQWRAHTNATVSASGTTATLTIDGQTMQVVMVNPPSGASFGTAKAERFPNDPPLPPNQVDQPNDSVTVLTVDLPAGQYSLQILFNPQWPGSSGGDFVTPPNVPVSSWTVTSHDQ